jgi:PPM family protein phosphatase
VAPFQKNIAARTIKEIQIMALTYSKAFELCEIGGRANNEDSIYPRKGTVSPGNRLFIVCDGVGGSAGGEFASAIVSETLHTYLSQNSGGVIPDEKTVNDALENSIRALKNHVKNHPETEGMACTLTFAYIGTDSILFGWCGDSRIYHIRDGEVLYKTTDHSMVGEMVRSGLITEEESRTNPNKNIILRSVNAAAKSTEVELHTINDVREGDYILLCTDGLLENVDEKAIREIFKTAGSENLAVTFNRYCYGRTKDNYSMYLVQLSGQSRASAPLKKPVEPAKTVSRGKFYALIGVIVLLVSFCTYLLLNNKEKEKPADAAYAKPVTKPKLPAKNQPVVIPAREKNTDSINKARLEKAIREAELNKKQKNQKKEVTKQPDTGGKKTDTPVQPVQEQAGGSQETQPVIPPKADTQK